MCGSAREDEEAWRGCGAVRKVFSVIIISHFRSNYNFYFSAIIQEFTLYSVILSSMPSPQNSVIRFTSKKLTPLSLSQNEEKFFFFSKGTATFYFNLVMIRISFEQRNCCEPIFCTGTGAPGGSGSAST